MFNEKGKQLTNISQARITSSNAMNSANASDTRSLTMCINGKLYISVKACQCRVAEGKSSFPGRRLAGAYILSNHRLLPALNIYCMLHQLNIRRYQKPIPCFQNQLPAACSVSFARCVNASDSSSQCFVFGHRLRTPTLSPHKFTFKPLHKVTLLDLCRTRHLFPTTTQGVS